MERDVQETYSAPASNAEIDEVVNALREKLLKARPQDIWQFCSTYFQEKLEEQRNMFLELIKQHPDLLGDDDKHSMAVDGEAEIHTHSSLTQFSFNNPFGGADGSTDGIKEDPTSSGVGNQALVPDRISDLRKAYPGIDPKCNYGRRFSVSAESMNPTKEEEYEKKVIPKTDGQRGRIDKSLSSNFLFRNLDEESYKDIVNAMEEKFVKGGEDVIVQGGFGDYFYIVEHGTFDIFVSKDDDPPKKVATVQDGDSFGELALMYNAPRAATVHARTDATLWALDRITFRRLLMERTARKCQLYEKFLSEVPILKSLMQYERQKIADALETVSYSDGEVVMKQGETGSYFYLIEDGMAKITKVGADGKEKTYPSLKKGAYFGELALIEDQPRQATVTASGQLKCARMSKDAFNRLLGPVKNIMERDSKNYQQ
ncbi:hypothetical protein H4219_001202 [Mycoemilia scoparia]|uniref:cAMP-dependent protein kinase regulatory subunit n=1 Tax=Mycoemilia scoparia TaxID=417184 RepID=A0A9W8A422_9FUNG|nr:hypothetical protein H4219_001202 [Mycoemilia scoparia]